jgi:hypothetical protein
VQLATQAVIAQISEIHLDGFHGIKFDNMFDIRAGAGNGLPVHGPH